MESTLVGFIHWLWDFVRELAILAAAVGIAKWTYDQHASSRERRDEEARRLLEEGRARADLKAFEEAILIEVREHMERARRAEDRAGLKVRIHRLLHAADDPYLTFAEIREGLAREAEEGRPAVGEDDLRRSLMELVAERCVAQMEGDQYFVGGDYEPDEADSDKA
jgi:hypothetical protein